MVARNRRVAGVEIDLIGFDRSESTWVLAEVKSSASEPRPENRLGSRQRRRLERACLRLGMEHPVRLVVIAVDLRTRPNRVEVFELE